MEEMCVEGEEEVGSGDFVRSQRIRILSVLIERSILVLYYSYYSTVYLIVNFTLAL